MSLEDDERSGRPSTSITPENVERIRELVHADRWRTTINYITDIVSVSYGSVQTILTSKLNMWRVVAKSVPPLLTPEQKERHVAVCLDLHKCAADNPSFTSRIITGDESWVYGYDPETKQQLSQWKRPSFARPKKARMSCSSMKTILVFFDFCGIVHREFVPQGHTINTKFYCEELDFPR
jgi:hypothetical protein